uniref:Uncharacterized protein n=1 Tax=Corethron hystrix TaxID=216773 RepID=A0A7S1BX43_9STRA|mmetsp:Transcript_5439/g.11235  ORF Transcript_5439/g.11235 Transcript_5439/m.11235 type:complete len:1220 (+) Transcript_5439:123-3782(+)
MNDGNRKDRGRGNFPPFRPAAFSSTSQRTKKHQSAPSFIRRHRMHSTFRAAAQNLDNGGERCADGLFYDDEAQQAYAYAAAAVRNSCGKKHKEGNDGSVGAGAATIVERCLGNVHVREYGKKEIFHEGRGYSYAKKDLEGLGFGLGVGIYDKREESTTATGRMAKNDHVSDDTLPFPENVDNHDGVALVFPLVYDDNNYDFHAMNKVEKDNEKEIGDGAAKSKYNEKGSDDKDGGKEACVDVCGGDGEGVCGGQCEGGDKYADKNVGEGLPLNRGVVEAEGNFSLSVYPLFTSVSAATVPPLTFPPLFPCAPSLLPRDAITSEIQERIDLPASPVISQPKFSTSSPRSSLSNFYIPSVGEVSPDSALPEVASFHREFSLIPPLPMPSLISQQEKRFGPVHPDFMGFRCTDNNTVGQKSAFFKNDAVSNETPQPSDCSMSDLTPLTALTKPGLKFLAQSDLASNSVTDDKNDKSASYKQIRMNEYDNDIPRILSPVASSIDPMTDQFGPPKINPVTIDKPIPCYPIYQSTPVDEPKPWDEDEEDAVIDDYVDVVASAEASTEITSTVFHPNYIGCHDASHAQTEGDQSLNNPMLSIHDGTEIAPTVRVHPQWYFREEEGPTYQPTNQLPVHDDPSLFHVNKAMPSTISTHPQDFYAYYQMAGLISPLVSPPELMPPVSSPLAQQQMPTPEVIYSPPTSCSYSEMKFHSHEDTVLFTGTQTSENNVGDKGRPNVPITKPKQDSNMSPTSTIFKGNTFQMVPATPHLSPANNATTDITIDDTSSVATSALSPWATKNLRRPPTPPKTNKYDVGTDVNTDAVVDANADSTSQLLSQPIESNTDTPKIDADAALPSLSPKALTMPSNNCCNLSSGVSPLSVWLAKSKVYKTDTNINEPVPQKKPIFGRRSKKLNSLLQAKMNHVAGSVSPLIKPLMTSTLTVTKVKKDDSYMVEKQPIKNGSKEHPPADSPLNGTPPLERRVPPKKSVSMSSVSSIEEKLHEFVADLGKCSASEMRKGNSVDYIKKETHKKVFSSDSSSSDASPFYRTKKKSHQREGFGQKSKSFNTEVTFDDDDNPFWMYIQKMGVASEIALGSIRGVLNNIGDSEMGYMLCGKEDNDAPKQQNLKKWESDNDGDDSTVGEVDANMKVGISMGMGIGNCGGCKNDFVDDDKTVSTSGEMSLSSSASKEVNRAASRRVYQRVVHNSTELTISTYGSKDTTRVRS